MLLPACRYVVQKIRAVVRGEAPPEKSGPTACSQVKGGSTVQTGGQLGVNVLLETVE